MDDNVMDAATRQIRILIANEERKIIMAQERVKALHDAINVVEKGIADFEKSREAR